MIRPTSTPTRPLFVLLAIVALVASACGDDSSSTGTDPAPTTTSAPGTSSTVPTSTSSSTTLSPQPVPAAELAAAAQVATDFVDDLGNGRVADAAKLLGPISEANTDAAGGVQSMLQQSTEGHGAWAGATDRTVTPIGMDLGLVVVVLEGTLRVEGTVEHRVAAFPVRKAESAQAWFVELWGSPIAQNPPLTVTSPAISDGDQATAPADPAAPLTVQARSAIAGTLRIALGTERTITQTVTANDDVTFDVPANVSLVTMVITADNGLVQATAFSITGRAGATPQIAVPFLDECTNTLLRACAGGDAASCDAAQVPGVLDDGAFSFFHTRCDSGDTAYCTLFDNLVAAELRMHGITTTTPR